MSTEDAGDLDFFRIITGERKAYVVCWKGYAWIDMAKA
jgi:hypothetical protein